MGRRVFGARFAFWVVFLVAAPIVALATGLSAWAIIVTAAGAYLFVLAVEVVIARRGRSLVAGEAPAPAAKPEAAPVEPEPVAAAEPEPEPVLAPPPPPPPVLASLPDLEPVPDPEPEPEAEPEPEYATVVTLDAPQEPRRWNLWELERVARERRGDDALLDEERTYLLLYLREFADAEGSLPESFDPLVRESFGDGLAAVEMPPRR
ncbi:MAG TPA: hypothetical protein VLW49_06410 [Gaiellaceae bacterium]|nr:hypothetical protein [Gaiellaceae bacterium]